MLTLLWQVPLFGESKDSDPGPTTDIYFIDVGFGNATLIVSPSGETMLLDTGAFYGIQHILDTTDEIGVNRIDYLVVSHYHNDHYGAAAGLLNKIPVGHFVDHGPSVEAFQDDDWWLERRKPWFKPDMGRRYNESFMAYVRAREKVGHIVVKAGDQLPVKGLSVRILTAGGEVISSPLEGAGGPNSECVNFTGRMPDDAEDAQSIGTLVTFGKFRFIYLGDLSWNEEGELFCPEDKVGPVDAYVITHHAQSFPRSMGDYYWGLSACPPCELAALRPRVAVLSLSARGHPAGDNKAMKAVAESPGLEDLWQTSKIVEGAERTHNPADDYIVNVGEAFRGARYIKLSASADGSFTMFNSRNQFRKFYPARK